MIQRIVAPTNDNKVLIELVWSGIDQTNPSKKEIEKKNYVTVSTSTLVELLNCGKQTAIEIGNKANAKICIGRRVLWNMKLIQEYLDTIAG